jgi:hypothetical protein
MYMIPKNKEAKDKVEKINLCVSFPNQTMKAKQRLSEPTSKKVAFCHRAIEYRYQCIAQSRYTTDVIDL